MSEENSFTIWMTTRHIIRKKMHYIKKIGGKDYYGFCTDYGDIPVCNINTITGKSEEVVNNRGRAYACRNRSIYQKNKRRVQNV